MTKTCKRCGDTKPVSDFPARSGGRLRNECRPCTREYNLAYRAARLDSHKARQAAYYAANREAVLAQQASYKAAWQASNPDAYAEENRRRNHRRRARIAQATIEDFSHEDLLAAWTALGLAGRCAYCPDGVYEHIDHVIPLARGGAHHISNLLPACARCNQSKGAKLLEEWRPQLAAQVAIPAH